MKRLSQLARCLIGGVAATFLGPALQAHAFNVGGYTTPEQLVEALLAPGWSPVPGSISVVESAGSGSIGFFNGGDSSIGLNSGVILTSGLISNAPGPNNSDSASGPGALSSLSFDFVAVSPGISWQYVFASEEYEEYVGSAFNDYFTLTLNGTNLALIPGTSTDVTINNVNPWTNSDFYRSNSPSDQGGSQPFDIQYDGFTVPLTAHATGLTVGQTYSLNFTISDVGDESWDSAVMIGANSVCFAGGCPDVPLRPPIPTAPDQPWVMPEISVFDPNSVWWLDPETATGSIFNVTDGPLFDQYIALDLPPNETYGLYSTGGGACSNNPDDYTTLMTIISGNNPYDFATPLACFAIKSIDEGNGLDPGKPLAIHSGVSFHTKGSAKLSQAPSPTPGPLPLLGVGATYRWARRLRQRTRGAQATD